MLYMMSRTPANRINLSTAWDGIACVSVKMIDSDDLLHSGIHEVSDIINIMFMITRDLSYPSMISCGRSSLIIKKKKKKIAITLLEEYLGKSDCEKFMKVLGTDMNLFTI